MNEIVVTDAEGVTKTLPIDNGLSLMEHLRNADYDEVAALCGGCCSCATCHVYIDNAVGDIPAAEEDEEMLLEMAEGYQAGKSRLSCQIELNEAHHGLHVVLPESTGF